MRKGERRVAIADFGECSGPKVSRSGRLVARACSDGTHVSSLETAKELRVIAPFADALWPTVLGFDRNEAGIVVAIGPDSSLPNGQHELRYLGLDGRDRVLGVAHMHVSATGNSDWPSFALASSP